MDSFTSVSSFSGSRAFNSLTEEDMTNLTTFYRLISLFSGMRGDEAVSALRNRLFFFFFFVKCKVRSNNVYVFEMLAASILQQVKATSKNGEALTPQDEASLVMYQLPSAEEILPILSIIPEVTSLHNTSPTLSKCFFD